MVEARFNLLFNGKVESGKDLDEARSMLESLFDFDTENQPDIFDGQIMVLGKNMDAMTAKSFKQALANEGIITHLLAIKDTVAKEATQSRRVTQQRINSERRVRVRGTAILPDRRLKQERRD